MARPGGRLAEHGFDVVHVYEVEQGGMSDPDQLSYSAQRGRAILTHNARDFLPLVVEYFFGGSSHNGLVLSPQLEKGELVRRTLNLLRSLSAEELTDSVRHLADFR